MLLTFRLGERVGTSVFQAEDTRNSKRVAVKVLTRQLPKDAARREALIRDVRVGAAVYHPSLINILEVAPAGDALLLIMDWVDGQPIAARVHGRPLDRSEFFRTAYQAVDALRMLHAKELVHGNVAGDSILVLASGQVKLCGLNITNLVQRTGQATAFQQKGSDIRAVAYMAPEQISNQAVTPQTDIFSLGLVLYEAATGRLAFAGANAAEVARKVVGEQPPSPKLANPNIDTAVLGLIGRSLFKDPFRRHKDTKAMSDEIARADPDAVKFAAALAKPGGAAVDATEKGEVRSAVLFLGDVASDASADSEATAKAIARMQQILGEAVYLFDGEVLDPFGTRLIAELPTVQQAIEAGRKGEFDFSAEQQGEEVIPVRLLLHAGDVEVRPGKVSGTGVTKGLEVLQTLPALKLHVSEDFLRKGRGGLRYRDIGARAGMKLYTIVEPEPQPTTPPPGPEEELDEVGEIEETAAKAVVAQTGKKQRTMILAAAAAAGIVILGGAGLMLMSKSKTQAGGTHSAAQVPSSAAPGPPSAEHPRKILLQPFTVEATDPAIASRAENVRLAAMEVLRAFPELQIADGSGPDVTPVTATVRSDTAGPVIVTGANATPMPDAASGVQSVIQFVSTELRLPPHATTNAEAFNALADAVAARAANDPVKTEAALRAAAKADPAFLPAQLMAMRFYQFQGKSAESLAAARSVLGSEPENLEAARIVAHGSLQNGDLASAFAAYGLILKKEPSNIEALNVLGRYAFGANDVPKFRQVLQRLSSSPVQSALQEPDLLLATGQIDSAIQGYYSVEEKVPNNPALELKIGRIAVLRHSASIADIELRKLQHDDPGYGAHILKAYLAAQSGAKADVASEMQAALASSTPGDDYWTSAAEVAVIGDDIPGAIEALKKAAERKEPTGAYVLTSPLFEFLHSDPEFLKVGAQIVAQQQEIRSALAAISL